MSITIVTREVISTPKPTLFELLKEEMKKSTNNFVDKNYSVQPIGINTYVQNLLDLKIGRLKEALNIKNSSRKTNPEEYYRLQIQKRELKKYLTGVGSRRSKKVKDLMEKFEEEVRRIIAKIEVEEHIKRYPAPEETEISEEVMED